MTNEELQEKLKYWQPQLGLADWVIAVEFVRHTEFDLREQYGECRQTLQKKWARILILDPIDRNLLGDYRDELSDPEIELVHELLHCLPAFDTDRIQSAKKERRVELTIHPISVALVREHRRCPA